MREYHSAQKARFIVCTMYDESYNMPVVSILSTVIVWIFYILIAWFVLVQVIVRIIRRFVHFPVPELLLSRQRNALVEKEKYLPWISSQNF